MTDSYEQDLAAGIGQFLETLALGVWRDDGVYTAQETGIVMDVMPSEPDNVIVLTPYGVEDDPSLADNVTGLQVRSRAAGRNPAAARKIGSDVFLALHGRTNLVLPTGLHVVQILRQSSVSDGQDENGRWTMIDNYYCDLHVPAMHVINE